MITPISNYSMPNTSFGSISRTIYDEKKPGQIKYKNNTWMFRYDLDWDKAINEITKGGKPKKIYCYACSDGSEPYTIAILLITKLGWEKAQQYFPIIARDIDADIIKKADSGILTLHDDDVNIISDYQRKSKVGFFDKISKRIFANKYKFKGVVSDKLRSCVDFGVGDICKDANGLDYNNSVIFFRNALPYLSPQKRNMLLATFARNINDTTAIVIGEFDKRVLGNPFLFMTNNHTFGLAEPVTNFFVGKRLKDFHKFPGSKNTAYSHEYSYIPVVQREPSVSMYNKFIKTEILANNRKLNNSARRRQNG